MPKPAEEIEITDADISFADDIIASRIEASRDRIVPIAIFESCLAGAGILHIIIQTRREINDYFIGGSIAFLGIGLLIKTLVMFRTRRNELLSQREYYVSLNALRRKQRGIRMPPR